MIFQKDDNYKYEVVEILGVATPQDSLKSNWAKSVLKTLMNDTEEGIDIRSFNTEKNLMSKKGIRLTIEEANNVADILIESGFGSLSVLEEAIEKRKNLFKDKPTGED